MRGDIALFLGLVTVIGGGIIAAFVILAGDDGGGGSPCDDSLVPIETSDISQLGFQAEEVGLTRMIQAAQAGDLDGANAAFFGDVHNFTHNIDPSVREVDEELAKALCEAVLDIEDELISPNLTTIAAQATRIRELIRDAAEALGFARPGG